MQYTLEHSGNEYRILFESAVDVVETALHGKARIRENGILADVHIAEHANDAWVGYLTQQRAREYLTAAPAALRNEIAVVREQIKDAIPVPATRRRKRRHNLDDGCELDPEAVLRRETNAWSAIEFKERAKSTVSIAINASVASSASGHALLARGATALALTDALTEMGKSVEVTLFTCSRGIVHNAENSYAQIEIVLKHAQTPSNEDTLIFAATHFGFMRYLILPAIMRAMPACVDIGMGFVMPLPKQKARQFDIVIDTNVCDTRDAMHVVKQYVREYSHAGN